MVGHYWLRNPRLAPTPQIAAQIAGAVDAIEKFAAAVHTGSVRPASADRFTDLLVIGIGGSALGPQFVADALGNPATDKMRIWFFDNTDPDGMARTLAAIGPRLKSTLSVVISKSGGTPETRNGMLIAQQAYQQAGLTFAKHAVAITGEASKLDKVAVAEGWLLRLPMWDFIGGRTSELATVGLFPAAMQGLDIRAMLQGAGACDELTRKHDVKGNPAALLAAMWHHGTGGLGLKDMVILPYKDRLLLLSRYLQQLVMESLGKDRDLSGNPVSQGISVYGNKGSTDQHAYVQQLREGVNNFFAVFIRVLGDGGSDLPVEPQITSGDYLDGLLLGTREALYDNSRESITITIRKVDAFAVGVLIALFERAVGLYATLVNINAYHQPGVEAGKKAAAAVLAIQQQVLQQVATNKGTAAQIAHGIGQSGQIETVLHILEHLAANGRATITGTLGDPEAIFG
jgi:glucose-6-phosphate isomerase